MRAFAIALDRPDDYFSPLITKPMARTRVIHYPEQTDFDDTAQWGIGARTDYECFTIFSPDGAGGLQVKNADGEWIEAPPIPGAFTINIGDRMQRWTNDIYGSAPHRVLNRSGRERYSLALFFGANYDSVVSCLPSTLRNTTRWCRESGRRTTCVRPISRARRRVAVCAARWLSK